MTGVTGATTGATAARTVAMTGVTGARTAATASSTNLGGESAGRAWSVVVQLMARSPGARVSPASRRHPSLW
jgi:hypothetical protein